jgi:DNA-binding protein H-NS
VATFAKLQKQIQALQSQAARLRKAEAASVIERLRTTIEEYSLTPEDLFGPAKPKSRKPPTKSAKSVKRAARAGAGVPKYRDPKTGKTWTGFGKPPGWIAGKRDRSSFLIAESVPTATATARPDMEAAAPSPAPKTAKPKAKVAPVSEPASDMPVKKVAVKKAAAKKAAVKRRAVKKAAPSTPDSSPPTEG